MMLFLIFLYSRMRKVIRFLFLIFIYLNLKNHVGIILIILRLMMKKQYNYYMDTSCKAMIAFIRAQDPQNIEMLNDSQIVERLIRKRAESLGYIDNDHFNYYDTLSVK